MARILTNGHEEYLIGFCFVVQGTTKQKPIKI